MRSSWPHFLTCLSLTIGQQLKISGTAYVMWQFGDRFELLAGINHYRMPALLLAVGLPGVEKGFIRAEICIFKRTEYTGS